MPRPVPMTRALIVGPRDELETTVEALHSLKLLHIVDHESGEDGLDIGKPLPRASEASEILVKLRSIASVLKVTEAPPVPEEELAGDLRLKILTLELNISEEDAARKKTVALLSDLGQRIDAIAPFAALPLRVEDYSGYESLEVFAGRVSRDIEGLELVTREHEAFQGPGLLVVFVTKAHAEPMRNFLAQQGFTSIPLPHGEGHPKAILENLLAEKSRWETRLAEIEKRLETLRERYAGFLAAARAHLEVTVEKAEAPLRFAVTDHTFIVEGWVPTEAYDRVRAELEGRPGLFAGALEQDHPTGSPAADASEAPTLLRNKKPIKPFEMLVRLFSTPNYHEIDPTFTVAFSFPIFFGLMIGDAGYGIAWLALGLFLLRRGAKEPGAFRDLVIAITWGGFWSLLFGLFFFAEAFGVPFHHSEHAVTRVENLDWSAILGFHIPIEAQLHKLERVTDFIVLSILAAYIHLAVAFGIGFFNDLGHSKKHALGKVSWLMILTGLFVVMIVRAARWPVDADGHTTYGSLIWNSLLGWFPRAGLPYPAVGFTATNPIPWVAIGLLVGGIMLLLVTEGALHLMEFFGLLANMVSYARLAAVGVAKAAMAFAFNVIVLDTLVFPGLDSGNYLIVALGFVFGFLFHMIVFLLGAVSAAIQSIRLNYVEYFIKFFKGAGIPFRPFGERTKAEV